MRNLLILFLSYMPLFVYGQSGVYTTTVYGVCEMCEERIEGAVNKLEFVQSSNWDYRTQKIIIEYKGRLNEDLVHETIAKVGHDTEKLKAKDDVYQKLHGCCHYRDPEISGSHSGIPTSSVIRVKGLCEMCKDRIETATSKIEGVTAATYNLDEQLLYVNHEIDFDEQLLHEAMANIGHQTSKNKVDTTIYNQLPSCCQYAIKDEETSMTIRVNGNCEMCKKRIEEAAKSYQGVDSASYNIENQILTVEYNKLFRAESLHQFIADAGHDTDQLLADDKVYDNLPECCRYRNVESKATGKINSRNNTVSGSVFELVDGKRKPLIAADIFLLGSEDFTYTDENGYFELEMDRKNDQIVIGYVGYRADTLRVSQGSEIEAEMSNITSLKEVVITYRQKSSGVSTLNTIKTFKVDDSELLKAACCNLAESFETLPAVDVATTDAVTGTRQIKMLGLSGPNILYTKEQIPMNTGIASIQGLTLIPGTWIASMQLNQGLGSVVDGYEGVSGQINVELRKPESMNPLYVNLYGNEGGRMEGNAHIAHRFNKKISTALLLHGYYRDREMDRNDDQFLDTPIGNGFGILNRWKLNNQKGLHAQVGVKFSNIHNSGGQLSSIGGDRWKAETKAEDISGWAKIGYLNPNNPQSSIGLKLGGNQYTQKNYFGNKQYDGKQSTFNTQLIYQNILGDGNHELRAAVGLKYEQADERLNLMSFSRKEVVPYTVAEYTFHYLDNFSSVLGLRYDYHNIFGSFFTPRLHLQYNFESGITVRIAAGQSRRVASVISENLSVLSSSRNISHLVNDKKPYGLPMIQTQNYSISMDYGFELFDEESSVSLDYFYTHFDENVIVDFDNDINFMRVYQQTDDSYSHNVQFQFDFRVIENWSFRWAYKWQQLLLGYQEGLALAPFTPEHRFFVNTQYETKSKWSFDLTVNLIGSQRIPNTLSLPEALRMDTYSPTYFQLNAQVSKEIFDGFSVYIGGENLTNYRQKYAIIGADNPFGNEFDASLVWGPLMGRNIYGGMRYTILKFDEQKFKDF